MTDGQTDKQKAMYVSPPCICTGVLKNDNCNLFKGKPFIPIHHMKAHALTARMIEDIEFPFLVLLVSGGHSLIAVAKSVDDFLLIGRK